MTVTVSPVVKPEDGVIITQGVPLGQPLAPNVAALAGATAANRPPAIMTPATITLETFKRNN